MVPIKKKKEGSDFLLWRDMNGFKFEILLVQGKVDLCEDRH